MKKILFNKKVIAFTVVVVLIGAYILYTQSKTDIPYEFIVVEKGDLIQEISVTGKIKAAQDVDLSFEQGGRVSLINVDIGDKVNIWQTLAVLDNLDLRSQVLQAEANLEAEQANLSALKSGTRVEELRVQEVKVENAQKNLNDAKRDVINKIQDAYTKSDDAIYNRVDQMFSNPKSNNPTLDPVTGQQAKTDLEWGRVLVENILNNWRVSTNSLKIESDLDAAILEAKDNLEQIRLFMNSVALMVNELKSSSTITQTTINLYRTDITTARTNIDTANTNLLTVGSALQANESSLVLAEQELLLKEAGSTDEQIATQEALVKGANANLGSIQAKLNKTIIKAPFSGIVTKKEVEVGEVISIGTLAFSLISEGQFEIEAYIPEVDIPKVNISDMSKITLDAYDDDQIFQAKVIHIDPAETTIEGVSTYKTTLQLIEKDGRILPGMTANIDILTASLIDVISIPSRAVISKNGNKVVKVIDIDNETVEVIVKTGIYDSEGNVEITEGVNIGDKVIIFTK